MPEPEAQKLLTDAEKVASMLGSDGWGIVEGKLHERILDLQNINNIDTSANIGEQIAARKMASELLFNWLKKDVRGFVEQQEANQLQAKRKDSYIEEH